MWSTMCVSVCVNALVWSVRVNTIQSIRDTQMFLVPICRHQCSTLEERPKGSGHWPVSCTTNSRHTVNTLYSTLRDCTFVQKLGMVFKSSNATKNIFKRRPTQWQTPLQRHANPSGKCGKTRKPEDYGWWTWLSSAKQKEQTTDEVGTFRTLKRPTSCQ